MLDHIDITVKDLNQSKKFYKSLLSVLEINEFSEDNYGVKFYDKKTIFGLVKGFRSDFILLFQLKIKTS
ncbi:VOC family protein [Lactococcus lactis]